MGDSTPVSDEELHKDIEAYRKHGGNKSAAARARGLNRITYRSRLEQAERRFKLTLGKIVDGRVENVGTDVYPLPRAGHVARYILTSAQNNTHVHPGFKNLLAYCKYLDELPKSSCKLIIGTYSYQLDAYGRKAVKRGTYTAHQSDDLWFAPELVPFLNDNSIEIAPSLIWCGEMNILPTAIHPLTGLDTYNGRASNIVPHAKFAMESVAALPDEATKLNYSTGTITQRNYIQKRAGIIAEQAHGYGGLLVEVDSTGNWYVRQLEIIHEAIYDIGPAPGGPLKIAKGKVGPGKVKAITWGDIHAAEMAPWVRQLAWGDGGMLDTLRPQIQFEHDVFSMRSRSHHEMKNFHRMFEKMVKGEESVQGEMKLTADFLTFATRPWVESVIVPSNHHLHLTRWLNEANPKIDPPNALYYMELQRAFLEALQEGNEGFNLLEYALRKAGLQGKFTFLAENESYVICEKSTAHGGIECGLHGHFGPNGSRGSTRNLTKLGRKVNKAHDHTAAWRGGVLSAGACALDFVYMNGPNSHTISHIINFENSARQIVTMWQGKYRA